MVDLRNPLVTPAWLETRLQSPDIAIIDASWFMPGTPRDPQTEFLEGHIPGASFFAIDEICDRESSLPHMLASPHRFETAIRQMGVNAKDVVVIYDSQGLFSAPRVWWNFRVMGHKAVFVLDGGLPAWIAEGRPFETGNVAKPMGDFHASPNMDLVRDLAAIRSVVASGDVQIVDARPAARFSGQEPEPRAGLRSGHMPGAINLPFSEVVKDHRLAPPARLEALFREAGVNLSDPIITTCGSGISASVLAIALACLGLFDVAVYDGSWTEWGGADDTPVVRDHGARL
jgi:thiosulfate/3-mercaptopyruvate sulfurtransferase